MEIHMKLIGMAFQLHLSTYNIIKNLLEKNLGENIPQSSNVVQSQFRTNPATVVRKNEAFLSSVIFFLISPF